MAVHYNVQVSVQEVREAVPPEMDQYGKVKSNGHERQVLEVLKVAVTKYDKTDALAAAIAHLTSENGT